MANNIRQTNEEFWRGFWRPYRKAAVDALLAGNDTGCFSTEQYRQKYMEVNPWTERDKRSFRIPMEQMFTVEAARNHLLSLSDLVREVKPDVWAAADIAEAPGRSES